MRAYVIDPRDIDQEIASPIYRVHFWEPLKGAGAWKSTEFEVVDAQDVEAVLRWARGIAGGRSFVTYVVHDQTLIRLAGVDPLESVSS